MVTLLHFLPGSVRFDMLYILVFSVCHVHVFSYPWLMWHYITALPCYNAVCDVMQSLAASLKLAADMNITAKFTRIWYCHIIFATIWDFALKCDVWKWPLSRQYVPVMKVPEVVCHGFQCLAYVSVRAPQPSGYNGGGGGLCQSRLDHFKCRCHCWLQFVSQIAGNSKVDLQLSYFLIFAWCNMCSILVASRAFSRIGQGWNLRLWYLFGIPWMYVVSCTLHSLIWVIWGRCCIIQSGTSNLWSVSIQ